MTTIASLEQLAEIYGEPVESSITKETTHLTPEYRAIIAAAPFMAFATSGPEGLDCSPRGDGPGFVRVLDDSTLVFPDRRGNNRTDSLRNIIRDPRVAMLFLIPGVGITLRINGEAHLSIDPGLLASFAVGEALPRCAVVVNIKAVYFQCPKAIIRSELWNPESHVDPASLPSAGDILAALSDSRLGGKEYDQAYPERAKATLW
ncbi:MAG: pyridoxamine 5'-phosphate oxidase family protein [Dehalococcoidia bacterium]